MSPNFDSARELLWEYPPDWPRPASSTSQADDHHGITGSGLPNRSGLAVDAAAQSAGGRWTMLVEGCVGSGPRRRPSWRRCWVAATASTPVNPPILAAPPTSTCTSPTALPDTS